jgi:hypothetical protein
LSAVLALAGILISRSSVPDAEAFTPPSSGYYLAVDCDRGLSGIQDDCFIPAGASSLNVDIVFGNVDVPNADIGALQFSVVTDQRVVNPRPGTDSNKNGNPDFNDTLTGNWGCSIPAPEPDRDPDPTIANSKLVCFVQGSGGHPIPAGTTITLATVRYDVVSIADATLDLAEVVIGNAEFNETLSCNPVVDVPGPCFAAHLGPEPEPTATNTNTPIPGQPSATPTLTPTVTNTATATATATSTPEPLVDQDGDSMFDVYEYLHLCLDPAVQDGHEDPDTDGLTSLLESQINTDACNADTDADGMQDGYEVGHSCLNPLFPEGPLDADSDTLSNEDEATYGTSPCTADTDGDGYGDPRERELGEDGTTFCPIMRADVNMDRNVNVLDLLLVARENGPVPPGNPRMDQTNDNKIDVIDLQRVAMRGNMNVRDCP